MLQLVHLANQLFYKGSQLSEQTNELNGFSDLDPIFTNVSVERIIDDNCRKGRNCRHAN